MRLKLLLLVLLTFSTFLNCLGNNFVGDDRFVVAQNPFYKNPANLLNLFTHKYFADSDGVLNSDPTAYGSGSVAWRPVLSLTYFMDTWLWGNKPWGFHLTNVLLHLGAVLLVFFLILHVCQASSTAFIGALIFGVHPLKSEAICSIGYRGDVLACLWVLLACLMYMRQRQGASYLFFILALLSKESAVVFPGLIAFYDWLMGRRRMDFSSMLNRYRGFIFILLVYAFIYVWVLPNTGLHQAQLMGGTWFSHSLSIVHIFAGYLIAFLNPLDVKSLPPLYAPSLQLLHGWPLVFACSMVGAFIAVWIKMRTASPAAAYFLGWFLLAWIPVSNLVPLVNPMAYRFTYLPSVGLAGALAVFFESFLPRLVPQARRLKDIVIAGFVGLCVLTAMSLNFGWKNNYVLAKRMMDDFPQDPYSRLFFAESLLKEGWTSQAADLLVQALNLGLNDPRGYYLLGLCELNDLEASKPLFERSIQYFPQYAFAYTGLGRVYLLKGDLRQAWAYLRRSLELSPSSYSAYGYSIQVLLMRHEPAQAAQLLQQAKQHIHNSDFLKSLSKLFDPGQKLPVDIGI